MNTTLSASSKVPTARNSVAIAMTALLLTACAGAGSTAIGPPGGGMGMPGGVSMPGGGGSSGGGSSGGGMPSGGSSGGGSSGGSSGGGMPSGGSSGGGMSGGSSGGDMSGGGMSGGGSSGGMGSSSPTAGMPSGGMSGGGEGGINSDGCTDGGITGGGIGGGAGCDQAGSVGQFPGDPDRAEQLGEELDKSVEGFDEALGEEQRQVSSVGRDTEGFGDGSGGSGGSIGLGEQAAGASGGSSSGSAGGGAGGAAGSSETQAGPLDGMSDEQIQARTPDDIEINQFEDIVARQLREAAVAEDDPVIRERLWEEYRKYNGLK